jgi:hypothetical protein
MKFRFSMPDKFELVNAGDGVTVKKHGWYLVHVDFYGLCLYKAVILDGIDVNWDGRMRVTGVDFI